MRQASDGADAASAARIPNAPSPNAASPASSSPGAGLQRITAIEAAGALAGMDLLQAFSSEPPAPQPAKHDPGVGTAPVKPEAASRAAPASTVALLPSAPDRPPASATPDLSPIPDRSAPNGDAQDGFETRALELVRGFWTGSGPPGDAEAGRGRDPATVADVARDLSPASAPLDTARLQDRDDDEFKAQALALARSFWPGSEPPGGSEGAAEQARAGADAAGDDAFLTLRAATPDATPAPAPAVIAAATAPQIRHGRSRRALGVAAGVVLAVCLGVAIPFLTDLAKQGEAPAKAAGETATRLSPPPSAPPPTETAAVAAPAAPPLAEMPAAAPADPPRSPPAASGSAETAERAIDVVAPPSQPAPPPPLILADVPPPEDALPVILRPAGPSPASTVPVAQIPVPPAPVNDPVTVLRAANPSPPVAPTQSIPTVASIRALPPILLTSPPDDDRGAAAVIVHPLPPAAESAPPVARTPPAENTPPKASTSALAQDSRPDGAASSLAKVEPAARPAATAVADPAPTPAPAASPAPGPAPAEQRPAIDPVQAAAMMRRADALAATGDLSGARLFYERLALVGDRQAALALARSYDPAWLRQQGVVGVPPDATRAAFWYARAAAGAAAADQSPQAKP
ncbi:MAG: hypothetical protein JNM30_03645 [Rhodospirillales bacterium]|nr:hypothetical protein [Rhodospirillales bacterium]